MKFFLCLLLVISYACAPPPATLSPQAQSAWKQLQIQKIFDTIRDIAQDAADMNPPVITVDTARYVTLWHKNAIQIIHDQPLGWKQLLLDSLNSLSSLPAAEYAKISQYVNLAKSIVQSYS